jgi:hypothetical protein
MEHESLVIILSSGGSPLEAGALDALGGVRVSWARVEREGGAACLAARVRFGGGEGGGGEGRGEGEAPAEFRERIRRWGAARGWTVTVASCRPLC